MPELRVHNLSVSLDGFAAGPNQTVDEPLGVRGEELHEWMFHTRFWQEMVGGDAGEELGDDEVAERFMQRGIENIGATIMGRNMFGPVRGEWGSSDWRGWWGDEPPYHHPVFVLTHFARPPIEMEGGTTFHFVDDGVDEALRRAFEAAAGADVRLGGGAATVREYLRARLVDDLHVAITPILLGSGERLLDDLGDAIDDYECVELVGSTRATHVRLRRRTP